MPELGVARASSGHRSPRGLSGECRRSRKPREFGDSFGSRTKPWNPGGVREPDRRSSSSAETCATGPQMFWNSSRSECAAPLGITSPARVAQKARKRLIDKALQVNSEEDQP